jgi:hypothetical protein
MPNDEVDVPPAPECDDPSFYAPADQLGPLTAALVGGGYRVEPMGDMGAASDGSAGGESATHSTIEVGDKDGHVGTAVLAIYSSIDATNMFDLPGERHDQPWCAPTFSEQADFRWDDCTIPAEGPAVVLTKGRDSRGDALGATYVRANGSIIGISISTAWYDRDTEGSQEAEQMAGDADPLDHLPLTEAQLTELLKAIEGTLSAN